MLLAWLGALIASYILLLPLLWFGYRRWLRTADRRLGRFLWLYLHFRYGARRSQEQALDLASLLAGRRPKAFRLTDYTDEHRSELRAGWGLTRRSGLYVQGLGSVLDQTGTKPVAGPGDDLPPIRPILSRRTWPLGDVVSFASPETETRLRDGFTGLCQPSQVGIAVSRGGRLIFESEPEALAGCVSLPMPGLTPFVASSLLGVLDHRNRLHLEQNVPDSEASFLSLANGSSGLAHLPLSAHFDALWDGAPDELTQTRKARAGQLNAAEPVFLSQAMWRGFQGRHGHYRAMPRQLLFDELAMVSTQIAAQAGQLNFVSGLTSSLRDMVRLGQVYANRGRLQDRQILSDAWVRQVISAVNDSGAVSALGVPGLEEGWYSFGLPAKQMSVKSALTPMTWLFICPDDGLVIALYLLPGAKADVPRLVRDMGRLALIKDKPPVAPAPEPESGDSAAPDAESPASAIETSPDRHISETNQQNSAPTSGEETAESQTDDHRNDTT